MASAEPILLSGVWLEFKKEPVHVHDIVREIVQVSKESRGKKVRIAFFYQNDSFDAVIPYGLEMLYQLKSLYPRTATAHHSKEARNQAKPEPRDKILVYGGKIYQYLKASYKDSYFGTGNFCNDLFGLGVVSQNGLIKGEKKIYAYGRRSKKKVRDKFLFSSRYTLFPSSEVASSIAAVDVRATCAQARADARRS